MEILDELKQLQANKTSLASSPAKFEKIQERSNIGSKFKSFQREPSPQEGINQTYSYKITRSPRTSSGYIKDTYIEENPIEKEIESPPFAESKTHILREEDSLIVEK